MSGFVAILDLRDGAVQRPLVEHLTACLSARGPEARRTKIDGPAGLGFTLFATTDDVSEQQQPCTVDGSVWIVGDVRLDDRPGLMRRLRAHGRTISATACDAALVLHAYDAWGEDCVDNLLGDFAFVIWDARTSSLFAARDHLGIKPCYFAQTAACLLVSNTLNCLRQHPAVADALNDQAIGDFLLFGFNHDLTTTTFAGIRRLPPAFVLTCRDGRIRTRRYWDVPLDDNVQYSREEEYVEHFRDLLQTAVADRLRTKSAGVMMSGGLDSTAIAAFAHEQRLLKGWPIDLRAYTSVYDRLVPDEERHYAALAAKTLAMPIHFLAGDDYLPFASDSLTRTPEPLDEATPAMLHDLLAQVEMHGRVLLTGFGGDPLLSGSPSYMMNLLSGFRWLRWIAETGRYVASRRRFPPLGLRSRLKRWLGWQPQQPPFPAWFAPEFAERLDLRRRHEAGLAFPPSPHPRHAEACQQFAAPFWPALFECLDSGFTGRLVELRHPLFDVRLLKFVLAIPPIPWCADKEILREAVRGRLPEAIRLRPKTVLAGDPVAEHFRRTGKRFADFFAVNPLLERYVNLEDVRELAESSYVTGRASSLFLARLICLSKWLDTTKNNHYPAALEKSYERQYSAQA